MINRVLHVAATELLDGLPDSGVDAFVFDPPAHLGVGEAEDETPLDEQIHVLSVIADQVHRSLRPGGLSIFMGPPQMISAWEVAATWSDLRLVGEIVVLWDLGRRASVPSLATAVRWHAKPGLRRALRFPVGMGSNVLVCQEVPHDRRYNPAQKPVELFNYLISLLTPANAVIVDPFCGAGSALVAAKMCRRGWIGGDIDNDQCKTTMSRLHMMELEEADLQPIYLWSHNSLIEV